MNILFIANVRMPTEKAHGLTIAKSCESFGRAGNSVTLIIPNRRTSFTKDVFDTYDVAHVFSVRSLFTVDLTRVLPGRLPFYIQTITFLASVYVRLLFSSRANTVIYTRDAGCIPLSLLGFCVVYECHHMPKRRSTFFIRCKMASRIVVISRALRDVFVGAGFAAEEILVAPSGVELATFDIPVSAEDARTQLKLPEHARIAVYSGNFTTFGEDKGLSEIVRTLPHIPDMLFVAVGGSDKDIARYTDQARGLGVSERVVLRGYASQHTLALYQKAADVLLMPFPDRLHYRQYMSPVKMFEYMASGRPIIATDLPTIREVLNDTNAVFVPPGDPEALAQAIAVTLGDSGKSHVLAEQARKDVARYTWQERGRRILAFIQTGKAQHV